MKSFKKYLSEMGNTVSYTQGTAGEKSKVVTHNYGEIKPEPVVDVGEKSPNAENAILQSFGKIDPKVGKVVDDITAKDEKWKPTPDGYEIRIKSNGADDHDVTIFLLQSEGKDREPQVLADTVKNVKTQDITKSVLTLFRKLISASTGARIPAPTLVELEKISNEDMLKKFGKLTPPVDVEIPTGKINPGN